MDTPYGTPGANKAPDDTVPRIGVSTETVIGRTKQMATEQVEAGVDRITNSAQSAASALRRSAGEVENDNAGIERRPWRKILAAYQRPSALRSILEIILSAAPLALIWAGAWTAVVFGLWWLALLLVVPAAAFLVRLFMVQHDCSHHAFFENAAANDWIGRIIGVFTLTPYDHWRRTHAIHHATSGNLDRRGVGEVSVLTVAEYVALPPWRRLAYRLYRHPLVLFVFGPAYLFLAHQRLPFGFMNKGWRPWLGVMSTNAAIAILIGGVLWFGGWRGLLLIHLPTMLIAGSIGVWLFYVQHQFENTYWARQEGWGSTEAALRGSSHYDLPGVLHWITANIGIHHVHHVASRIPFYRLQTVLHDYPELKKTSRLSIANSIGCVRLSLWDEASHKLISFRQFNLGERTRNESTLVSALNVIA